MITGVKPKETISQTVSICTPNSFSRPERIFILRAILPSNISQRPASRNITTPILMLPFIALKQASTDETSPSRVTRLAML